MHFGSRTDIVVASDVPENGIEEGLLHKYKDENMKSVTSYFRLYTCIAKQQEEDVTASLQSENEVRNIVCNITQVRPVTA